MSRGVTYCLGPLAPLVSAVAVAAPAGVVATVAGLALLGTFGTAAASALGDVGHREAAAVTLVVAASGIPPAGSARRSGRCWPAAPCCSYPAAAGRAAARARRTLRGMETDVAVDRGDALREPSQRVSPRARMLWLVGAVVEGAVLVAAAVAAAVLDWTAVVAGGGRAVLAAWAVVVPQWRYLVHRWEVTDTAVYTQTGWWARERRIAPMSRIQTVDHSESAAARLFGLATVTVTTASAAGALQIAGLDRHDARRLVAELTARADAVEGDAT